MTNRDSFVAASRKHISRSDFLDEVGRQTLFSNAAPCICSRACTVCLENTIRFILLNPAPCLCLPNFFSLMSAEPGPLSVKSCPAQICQRSSISPKYFACIWLGKHIYREFQIHSSLKPLGAVRIGSVKCGSLHWHYYVSPRLSDIWLNKKMNHCHPSKRRRTKSMSRMV